MRKSDVKSARGLQRISAHAFNSKTQRAKAARWVRARLVNRTQRAPSAHRFARWVLPLKPLTGTTSKPRALITSFFLYKHTYPGDGASADGQVLVHQVSRNGEMKKPPAGHVSLAPSPAGRPPKVSDTIVHES
jgi:hypothetical protein